MSIVCSGVEYVAGLSDGVLGGVLGAVLGSGITLLGVWRQNVNSREQLRMQMGHEATQAATERQMSLRREVFAKAATWAASMVPTIDCIAELKRPMQETIDKLNNSFEIRSRVEMVGNATTVQRCVELDQACVASYTGLAPLRRELESCLSRAKHSRSQQNAALPNSPQWFGNQRDADNLDGEATDLSDKLRRLVNVESVKNTVLAAKLMVAMRKELELPTDEEAYISLATSAHNESIRRIEEMLAEFYGQEMS